MNNNKTLAETFILPDSEEKKIALLTKAIKREKYLRQLLAAVETQRLKLRELVRIASTSTDNAILGLHHQSTIKEIV